MFTQIFSLTVTHLTASRYPAFAAETEHRGISNGWMQNC